MTFAFKADNQAIFVNEDASKQKIIFAGQRGAFTIKSGCISQKRRQERRQEERD